MTSGTFRRDSAFERRPRSLYLSDDAQRDSERSLAIFTRHDNVGLASDGRDETVKLQSKRLALRCSQRDVVDKVGDVDRNGSEVRVDEPA